MQDQIARVEFLIAQRRFADAQAEAMRLVAQHPAAPQPHALLAWALMADNKTEEALAPAQQRQSSTSGMRVRCADVNIARP